MKMCALEEEPFFWKSNRHGSGGGKRYAPAEMETRHLFMTLVMVWNATCPDDLLIRRSGTWVHYLYRLGASYTRDYLIRGIRAMSAELATRDDMEPAWVDTLNRMVDIIKKDKLIWQ